MARPVGRRGFRGTTSVQAPATASFWTVVNKEIPVSSTTNRRRAPGVLALVVGALLLVGCGTGQGQADSYADMEENFLDGCAATVRSDVEGSDAATLPDDFCRCAFDALSDPQSGVDFDEIREINDDLSDDPAELPESVTAVFADCA